MTYERAVVSSRASIRKRILSFFPVLPILSWIRTYQWREWLLSDVVAGLTVTLVLLPQCIAYAVLAGLPVRFGLLSSYLAPLVYLVLGSTREISMGPSALSCLLISRSLAGEPVGDGPKLAIALAFFVGIVQLAVGLFRLGFLVELMSLPAMSGFISAIALTIVVSQFKSFFHTAGSNRTFATSVEQSFRHLRSEVKVHYPDLILGLAVMLLLGLLQFQEPAKTQSASGRSWQGLLVRLRRVLALTRYAIALVLSMSISYIIYRADYHWRIHGKPAVCTSTDPCSPFTLVGHVESGLRDVLSVPSLGGSTLATLGGNIPLIGLVGLIETIAVCRALKSSVDPSQEFVALGAINVLGSFLSAFPVSTSPPRTAVNKQSGVRSPLGGLVTSLLVIFVLEVAASLLFWIPKAALAGVVVMAATSMFQWSTFVLVWKCSKAEAGVMIISFVACTLLSVGAGLVVACCAAFGLFLYQTAKSAVECELLSDSTLLVTLNSQLCFPIVGQVRRTVRSNIVEYPQVRSVILSLANVSLIDTSAAIALVDMCVEMSRGIPGHRADLASGRGQQDESVSSSLQSVQASSTVSLVVVLAHLQPAVAEHLSRASKAFDSLRCADSIEAAEALLERTRSSASSKGSVSSSNSSSTSGAIDVAASNSACSEDK